MAPINSGLYSGIFSSPKRVVHLLWFAAALLFLLAAFHTSNLKDSTGWVTDKVQNVISSNGGGGGGRLSMREHNRIAEASWAKTVKQRHQLMKDEYGDASQMTVLFPSVHEPPNVVKPFTIWDFVPASWGCPHEVERVGRLGDGGKWVCGLSRFEATKATRPCVIYSFGVSHDSTFEEEMLSRTNCEVWGYDFTVTDFGVQLSSEHRHRAHFLAAGISDKTDTVRNPPFYSISDLLKKNNHQYIDILKLDIEFAEFAALDQLVKDFSAESGKEFPIGQMMIEIHLSNMGGPGVTPTPEEFLNWWERLEERGLRPTWTEPNLLAVTMNVDGTHHPFMAEYTFINVHDSRSTIFGGIAVPRQ